MSRTSAAALLLVSLFFPASAFSAGSSPALNQTGDKQTIEPVDAQAKSGNNNITSTTTTTTTSVCSVPFGPPALIGFADDVKPEETSITSINTVAKSKDSITMKGDVQIQRDGMRLHADEATYNQSTEIVTATGGIEYEFSGVRLSSSNAEFNLAESTGKIAASGFWISERHLRGEAESIRIEGKQVLQLDDALITSCEAGKSDWLLKASELRLDRANNEGIAKHARLEFMHVPFFYFPYLSFPIDGRKTGFLVPDFVSSDSNGKELGVPWYWNIAPHRDATITPWYFSDRGVQLQTEFRYLNQTNAGQLDLTYLQDDDKYNDDRYFSKLKHEGHPAPGWRIGIDATRASDGDYLNDFGGELVSTSLTHLEQRLSIDYQADGWRFNSLFESYQTMDETIVGTSRPYRRLPYLALIADNTKLIGNISMDMSTEFVDFDREEGVTGRRVDIQSRINWDYQRSAGFARAGLGVRHTRYHLENDQIKSEASRSLPIFSFDSGLFFERDMTWGDSTLLQTLEPRLFYLYVPYRDQSQLPVFDSSIPQLGFSQLFRENRFSGVDRAGDASQMTVALSSRLYSEQGREMFSASLGQIHYFKDRRVMLSGQTEDSFNRSDVVTELRSRWSQRIDSSASLLWNSKESENTRGAFKFRYQQDQDRIVHLAYRYEREAIDQADFSVLWPLYRQWKAAGRWYYSFHDETMLERVIGIEYESCCWALRVVSRDHISDTTNTAAEQDRNESIWLQLELKGLARLASVGKKTKDLFTSGRLEN